MNARPATSFNTRGWTKAAINALELARSLGWYVHRGTGQAVILRHDGTDKQVTLSHRLRTQGHAYRNVVAQLKQHGDSASSMLAEQRATDPRLPRIEAILTATGISGEMSLADQNRELEQYRRERQREEVRGPRDERKVVAIKPWMAKQALSSKGGYYYPSHAVLERAWSDDTVDYFCAFEGCEFEAAKPRSVSAHFGMTHTRVGEGKGWAEARKDAMLVPGSTWEPTHRQHSAIKRLAGDIERAMERGAVTPEEIAKLVIEARINDGEHTDHEPLSAEDILHRIRRLVDTGQLYSLETQVEQLNAQHAALEAENTRLAEEAATYRGRWTALRELITDEDDKEPQ